MDNPRSLSEREQETMNLLAKGLSVADVAAAMGITKGTAHQYLQRIYRKLGVGNKTQAMIRLGMVKK